MSFRSSLSIMLVCALLGGAAFLASDNLKTSQAADASQMASAKAEDVLAQLAPAAGEVAATAEKAVEKTKEAVEEKKEAVEKAVAKEEKKEDVKAEEKKGDATASLATTDKRTPAEVLASHTLQIAYGKEDAPVTVVEYFSLSCPHCAAFYKENQPKLMKDYVDTGKVRYLLRYFPHNAPGMAATMLMQCVDEDNKIKFLQALFNMQEKWAFTEEYKKNLQSIAQIGGVGAEDFDKCLANKDMETKVLTQRQEATDLLKIDGIPALFVNGQKLANGDYRVLVEKIEAELKAAKE